MGIKDWKKHERPREKLLKHGASSLSLPELLAILLRSGTADHSAVDLAGKILQHIHFDLSRLEKLNPEKLKSFKGIGDAKAAVLTAAFELSRRRALQQNHETVIKINSANDAYNILKPYFDGLDREEFRVLLLRKGKKIDVIQAGIGGLDFSLVDLRIFWRNVLNSGATEIIVAHNHPSGNLHPSRTDIDLTRKIYNAGKLLQIRLIDHLIITSAGFLSIIDKIEP